MSTPASPERLTWGGGQTWRGFGVWVWISLSVIVGCSIYADISRFVNPSGEKYMPGYYVGGQVDFSYPYLSARALVAGENPYITTAAEYQHPVFKPAVIDGQAFSQLYPATHVWMYVPLVWLYGADSVAAGRCFFNLSLACLVVLAVLTWRLLPPLGDAPHSPWFIGVVFAALTLHPGGQLGLERGQSDILMALFCWSAVFFFTRARFVAALFFTVWAVAMKVYPVLFALGMGVLALRRGVWRRAGVGVLIGLGVLVLPVAHLVPLALKASLYRSSEMFSALWFNHGFKNFVYHAFSPGFSDRGRQLLTAIALLATALWAWVTWTRRAELTSPPGIMALVLFTTTALATMIGYSTLSVSYNLMLILPGVIILAASQDQVALQLQMNATGRHVLGASITFASFCLFLCRWNQRFPLAGLGLVALLGLLAAIAVVMPLPERQRRALPGARKVPTPSLPT